MHTGGKCCSLPFSIVFETWTGATYLKSVFVVRFSLTVGSFQHQNKDLAEDAAPQNCLMREVEGIAQRLGASLEEIRRRATEPREEERKLGEPGLQVTVLAVVVLG